jgi:hypothetical protein
MPRQRFPYIRLGNSKLSSNAQWRDPGFEGSADGVYFANRQSDGDFFDPPFAQVLIGWWFFASTLQLVEHCSVQLIEFLVRQILYGVGQVLGEDMPARRRRIAGRCGTRRGRLNRRGEQIRRHRLGAISVHGQILPSPPQRYNG